MLGYKTKYLCSGIVIFFKKLLTEYMDHKHVNITKINLRISSSLLNIKIKERKTNGNKEYPNKQNIWKILVWTPNKLAFIKTRKLPNQKIIKINVIVLLLLEELEKIHI